MKKAFQILLFLFSFGILAQEDVVKSTQPTSGDTLPIKTIRLVDTLVVQKMEGDLPVRLVTTKSKDSLVFDLKDDPLARQIDSLWMKELYNNELFEEIYGSIIQMDYEPVDYEDCLPKS